MNEEEKAQQPETIPGELTRRCPHCDSVVSSAAEQCLMCGAALPAAQEGGTADAGSVSARVAESPEDEVPESFESDSKNDQDQPAVFETRLQERQSPAVLILAAIFVVFLVLVTFLFIRYPVSASVALFPTPTAIPPTNTSTPTWTPLPTETGPASLTPTITLTPLPTDTPRPPRLHQVSSGETLFGLSLRYGITPDSIADANGLPPNTGLQVSQELIIPWPTATPPLVPVEVEIGGATIIADPSGCDTLYEIQSGDTLFGIASRARVDLRAILAVNRLNEQSILQPGDRICIPEIVRSGVLPPTPGPSPTATETPPPPGPELLYPPVGAQLSAAEQRPLLQWVTVKDLAQDEWYMVEVTDLSDVDSHPLRAFTRETVFQLPDSWQPTTADTHEFRWRVSIVQVTGRRADGSFIYTFGGNSSEDGYFQWSGAG